MSTGRKSKFSVELAQKIIEGVRIGLPPTRAGLACGVASSTLFTWMATKSEFSSDIKRAEAEFEGECLGVVQAAAPKSWQAAAWLLERRFDYKATQRTEISGKNGGPIQSSISKEMFVLIGKMASRERILQPGE